MENARRPSFKLEGSERASYFAKQTVEIEEKKSKKSKKSADAPDCTPIHRNAKFADKLPTSPSEDIKNLSDAFQYASCTSRCEIDLFFVLLSTAEKHTPCTSFARKILSFILTLRFCIFDLSSHGVTVFFCIVAPRRCRKPAGRDPFFISLQSSFPFYFAI